MARKGWAYEGILNRTGSRRPSSIIFYPPACGTPSFRGSSSMRVEKALYICANRKKMVHFMKRRHLHFLWILCAAGTAPFLASCAADQQPSAPPMHKMVGT